MTATLFVACSSSPEKENYSVKVVLEGAKNEGVSLGIDGTYYMNGTTKTKKPVVDYIEYILYSDPMCMTETGLFLYLRQSGATKYYVGILPLDKQIDISWESEEITATSSITTLSVKASDIPFINAEGNIEDEYNGTIKMYAREDVVLTISGTPE